MVNKTSKKKLIFILPIWLLFLPNAPYILTDLIHLNKGTLISVWYDLLLLMSYSFVGLLLFFLSVNQVFLVIKQLFSIKKAWFLTVFVLFTTSFGIYLGRFLRWNSWDIIQKPQLLLNDVLHRFIYPTHHPRTWGITLGFGLFFLVIFIGIRAWSHPKTSLVSS